ncbi:glutamate--tRNA ligase [Aureisphaera galaxeae]|uniref:glutamate--tRNA ligase n=1 Tax=Aureisphaera galaxeae TaxID=1538023 RepID=UPI0023508812|nr:glutamate--tRNA ligase [Aureisphaera galaxeae]MDC8005095.1 glutamate--tRNA ligase [Aureisphaera galaxeae]
MAKKVRVRFAPSPTGPLHIGGVRTALFNYLFAKKHDGVFVLRVEDTDQTRYVEGAEDYIKESLEWLNIPYDEGPGKEGGFGPYRQSERKHLYKQYADRLIAEGKAYYAFDTPEELAAQRSQYEAEKKTFIYNWHNRLKLTNSLSLSEAETRERLDRGDHYTIRFKSPENEMLHLKDLIRGDIQIDTNTLDDKVLFKSDGMPTYHLANIVDDHLMEITHVIRGEEWLPSLALHQQLYDAFGWEAPQFAHLSLILKPNGKGKLSKRDGEAGGFPVFPLEWNAPDGGTASGYREDGYLSEAVLNMLAFLGWNPGTEQELFDLEGLIQSFSLEKVNKAGAKFDPEKAKWFQQQYFQQQENASLATQFESLLKSKGIETSLPVSEIVSLVKERATFVSDLWDQASFFFEAPTAFDEKASKKAFKEDTPAILTNVLGIMENVAEFNAATLSTEVKGWITSQEMGFGKVMMPLRLSLVGEMKGPDVFDIAAILGKDETLSRIQKAIETIS